MEGGTSRMSDAEGLMWRLEKDPFLSSTFASIMVLDRPPDVDRLRRTMERAARVIPRLRRRVQPATFAVLPPAWVDDPTFDIGNHLRTIALPPPGSRRQLEELATLIVAEPFDRARPLWEFVVVDGLEDGRVAIVQKVHHTVTDGEGGIQLALEFLDTEPDAPERPPVEAEPTAEPSGGLATDLLHDVVAGSLRLPVGLINHVSALLAEPARIPEAGAAVRAAVQAILGELTATDRARSPLWTERSLRRAHQALDVPLEPVRLAAKAAGGTLNAAFIAATAAAAGDHHRLHDHPVDELRASMAVSTRTDDSGANAFTLTRLLVPTAPMPMVERVRLVAAAAATAQATTHRALLEVLAALAAALPDPLVTRVARSQAQTVDFATSNVRGVPVPLYVAGARVLAIDAVGPLVGVAFNATMLSYCGSLHVGLHCDRAAVPDAGELRAGMVRAFDELVGGT